MASGEYRDCGECENCLKRADLNEDEDVTGLKCLKPELFQKKKKGFIKDLTPEVDKILGLDRRKSERREQINHPEHYGGDTTYEVIKVIEAWKLDFHLGNAVKYIARAFKKDDAVVDLKKAVWYIQRKIDELEKKA